MAAHFQPSLFRFLEELRAHNDRAWFAAQKARYERDVRDPMLAFIRDVGPGLAGVSRQVRADPRPSGGSLFRIYRDTRFSKDKTPYKTHVAAHFRHRAAKDVHAPGFYLQLAQGEVFLGAGLWRPEPAILLTVRQALAAKPALWRRAVGGAAFRRLCRLEGDVAKRPPRGFDAGHPLIDDLRRKDFVAVQRLPEKDALGPRFLERFVSFCRAAAPLNAFLCRALGQKW
jgi:uncharacterized protein (TIGR02453 family)